LAREISEDSSSIENGGDLGTLTRGQIFPALDEAIFGPGAEALNTPFGPIETPMGYHLFLVRSHSPAATKTLDEALPELTASVKRRKARAKAAERIEELEKAARYPATLADGAKALGLETQETDFFPADKAPDFFAGQDSELQRAFRVEIGQLSYPATSPNGYFLYVVTEKKDSFIPPFGDPKVQEKVSADWLNATAGDLAQAAAKVFLTKVAASGWDQAIKDLPSSVAIGQTPLFRRLSAFEAGEPLLYTDLNALLKNYATLAQPGQFGPEPVPIVNPDPSGYLALALAKVEPADESEIDQPGGFSSESIKTRVADAFYDHWLAQATKEVEIKLPADLRALIEG
jgi:hypothetical protein